MRGAYGVGDPRFTHSPVARTGRKARVTRKQDPAPEWQDRLGQADRPLGHQDHPEGRPGAQAAGPPFLPHDRFREEQVRDRDPEQQLPVRRGQAAVAEEQQRRRETHAAIVPVEEWGVGGGGLGVGRSHVKSRERERVGLPSGKSLPDGRGSFRTGSLRSASGLGVGSRSHPPPPTSPLPTASPPPPLSVRPSS